MLVLGLFFLAPLYYIFLFSVALRRFSPTEALAMLKDGIERQYRPEDDQAVVDVTLVERRRTRYAEAIGNARNWDDRIGEPDQMDQALAELLAGAV